MCIGHKYNRHVYMYVYLSIANMCTSIYIWPYIYIYQTYVHVCVLGHTYSIDVYIYVFLAIGNMCTYTCMCIGHNKHVYMYVCIRSLMRTGPRRFS